VKPPSREQKVFQILQSLRRLYKALNTTSQELQAKYGVTLAQAWALFSILDSGSLSLRKLSKMMFVRPSTASVVIERLISKGYVAKNRLENDQRTINIALTEAGTQFLKRIPRFDGGHLAQGLAALGPDDLDKVYEGLLTLVNILNAQDVEVTFLSDDQPDPSMKRKRKTGVTTREGGKR
jgi:DNA-binding MarR family transcriptional regulator